MHPGHTSHGPSLHAARDRARSNSNVSLKQSIDSFVALNYHDENSKYFGVPLEDAIEQAAAKISILAGAGSGADTDANGVQYGKIPIVVAKCGVFLKKKGLTVEGIFRVGGSSKRIKELQAIFNTPPDFGKKLSWEGYNVHDAASVLRRYLNALPEPLIPLAFYQEFRMPLLNRPRVINYLKFKAENPKKTPSNPTGSSSAAATSEAPHGSAVVQLLLTSPPSNKAASSLQRSGILSDHDYRFEKALESEVIESMIPKSPHLTSIASKESQGLPNLDQITSSSLTGHSNANALDRSINSTPDSMNSKDSALKTSEDAKGGLSSLNHKRKYKKLTKDVHDAIDDYTRMVEQLPILSKQLLFYILDLLAMVQNHSAENRMPSRNLAAIFQPSILSHPDHDMDPEEYALSQYVVEFLIQYAYRLLPNEELRKASPKKSAASTATTSASTIEPVASTTTDTLSASLKTAEGENTSAATEVTTPTRKPKAPTSEIPKIPSNDPPLDPVTPVKAELPTTDKSVSPNALAVSKAPSTYRPHSKSLPINSNDEDLVVYQTSSALPSGHNVIDSDIGMTDDSSDDESEARPSSRNRTDLITHKLSDLTVTKADPKKEEQLDNEFDFGSSSNLVEASPVAVSTNANVSGTTKNVSAHPSPKLDESPTSPTHLAPDAEIVDSITPPRTPLLNGSDYGHSESPKIVVSEVPH